MQDDELIAMIINRTGMQRQSARMLCVLWNAKGRIVTQSSMADKMFDLSGERTTLVSLVSSLVRMRPKLVNTPLVVETIYGVGWRVVCDDPSFNWEL